MLKIKMLFGALLALAISVPAFAHGGSSHYNATANSQTASTANSNSANAGNAQAITFNNDSGGSIKTVPSLGGNSFYGSFSTDNCMVSGGVGATFLGGGGSIVTPIRDEQCSVLRGVERTMQVAATVSRADPSLSHKLQQGAVDMLCNLNSIVGNALKQQGVCTEPKKQTAQVASANHVPTAEEKQVGYSGNDPIVRRRLGLPPVQ